MCLRILFVSVIATLVATHVLADGDIDRKYHAGSGLVQRDLDVLKLLKRQSCVCSYNE
jgi:hypothetical protein